MEPVFVSADEGMLTFDNPPIRQLRARYGFTPTEKWLDHVRLASVRFNDGGSGSFVSPHGLFYARTAAEELKCPDLELNVLEAMQNVTARA